VRFLTDPQYISPNFTIDEFTCRCGCLRWCASYRLILMLEKTRSDHGDRPVIITKYGGFRCNGNFQRADWNHARGGSDYSYHSVGGAADHYIPGVPIPDLYDYYTATYPNTHGFIQYPDRGFVHADTRIKPYRQTVRDRLT
jgi:uncharacterized protein YcbK (DUF882 family)